MARMVRLLILKWHKRIGILSALFVMLLVITGILLNHTDRLGLQDSFVNNTLILNAYDINPEGEPYGFVINNNWISKVGDRVYFNQQELYETTEQLNGVVSMKEFLAIALDESILLVTTSGEIVERLTGSEGVPHSIQSIGRTIDNGVVIRSAQGDFIADFDNASWQGKEILNADWSTIDIIPDELNQKLLELYRGRGLSLERVMLDLHSGRIFGNWGVILVDVMAILFFLLALSGTWMWFKHN